MKRKQTYRGIFFVLGLALLLSFYLFSREVKHGFLKQADFDTTVKIQDRMPKRFDGMWEDISFFVEPGPSVIVCGLLTIVALVDSKKKRSASGRLSFLYYLSLLCWGKPMEKMSSIIRRRRFS